MIIQNAFLVNGQLLLSKHRHDFQYIDVKVKGRKKIYTFFVDGGREYFRSSVPELSISSLKRYGIQFQDLRLDTNCLWNEIYEKMIVFIFDEDTKENKWYFLKDITSEQMLQKMHEIHKIDNVFCKLLVAIISKYFLESQLHTLEESGIKFT